MKHALLLIFMLYSTVLPAGERIIMDCNSNLSFVHYLTSICSSESHGRLLRDLFYQRRGPSSQDEAVLVRARTLLSRLPDELILMKEKDRTVSRSLRDILYLLASSSKEQSDFRFHLQSVIPYEILPEFFRISDYLRPVFEQIFYLPGKGQVPGLLDAISSTTSQALSSGAFNKVARFFGLDAEGNEFRIMLVPISLTQEEAVCLNRQGGTSFRSESFGPLQVVECPFPEEPVPSWENYAKRITGIAMHEIIHYCQNMSPRWSGLESLLLQNHPAEGRWIVPYLREAVATAAGNAYLTHQSGGDESDSSWYGQSCTDEFSKSVFPLIKGYLDRNASVDEVFFDGSRRRFEQVFPHSENRPSIFLLYSRLETAGMDQGLITGQFIGILRKSMPSFTSGFAGEPGCTVVYAVRKGYEGLLPKELPINRQLLEKCKRHREYYLAGWDKVSKNRVLVIVCQGSHRFSPLLEKFLQMQYIEESGVL
ncbi:MAG: hypothetical protein PHQ23_06465 [Candidatus Wallbacteria bacterium]|nr:hypothetical protein [Candidatus Wallbacteria bacterium]